MSGPTPIEWTDLTWNPTRGCSRVSAGCDHCYAEGIAARFSHIDKRGTRVPPFEGLAKMVHGKPHWTGKIALVEDALLAPLRWRRPRRIFVNSMSDLFHVGVPDAFIDRVFAIMALCPQHTFQVLTKRPERMQAYISNIDLDNVTHEARKLGDIWPIWPLPNVWKGVSVENQEAANLRIPLLLQTPAAVRFISAEPLLGAPNLEWFLSQPHDEEHCPGDPGCCGKRHYLADEGDSCPDADVPALDWVICGGESGPGARPMHPDWARSLRDQCVAAGVPFFFKQWGEWTPFIGGYGDKREQIFEGGQAMLRVGKKRAGRLLDGREWSQFPEARP